MKKNIVFTILALVLAINLMGCKNGETTNNIKNSYTIVDGRGKTISLQEPPHKIMSFHYSTDEILLDLLPINRIMAISRGGTEPALSHVVDKAIQVKLVSQENLEFVVANKPDLAIIRENFSPAFIQSLEDAGIAVYVTNNPKSVKDIKKFIMQIAKAVHEEAKGQSLVKKMEQDLSKVIEKNKISEDKWKTAMIVSSRGAIDLHGSIVDEIFTLAQIKNATAALEIPYANGSKTILSKEQIVKANPDVLLVIDWDSTRISMKDSAVMNEYRQDESLQTIKAVQKNQLFNIPMKDTICFTHYISEAVADLSQMIYE